MPVEILLEIKRELVGKQLAKLARDLHDSIATKAGRDFRNSSRFHDLDSLHFCGLTVS
jgi:hypothetical protein